MPALGGIASIRTAHANQAATEIHVRLAQAKQFSLAKTGVDRGGEERSPMIVDGAQDRQYFLDVKVRWKALGQASEFHIQDRILTDLAHPTCGTEHATKERAQMIHGLRCQFARLGLDELLDTTARHFANGKLGDIGFNEMPVECSAAFRVGRRVAKIGVFPPAQQIAEGGAIVGSERLQPESLSFRLAIKIGC